jgi:hypothetical protein
LLLHTQSLTRHALFLRRINLLRNATFRDELFLGCCTVIFLSTL